MIPKNTCPECNGRDTFSEAIVCSQAGCRVTSYKCRLCGGRGKVDDDTMSRWFRGRQAREKRKAAGRTLRQEAERLGITQVELSKIERGEGK